MKKLKKISVLALAFCLVNAFTVQAVFSANSAFENKTITPHKPEIIRASDERPLPAEQAKAKRGWLSRNKWWVMLAVAVVAGGAAAGGGGGGGGGGSDDTQDQNDPTGNVEVTW